VTRNRLLESIGASGAIESVFSFLTPTVVTVANEALTASVKAPAAAPVLEARGAEPDLLRRYWLCAEKTSPLRKDEVLTLHKRQRRDLWTLNQDPLR
jgi:hypothetical protein